MMKFEYQYSPDHAKVTVELPPDSTLTEVLEQFEAFLKASGYSFAGQVDIISEETNVEN